MGMEDIVVGENGVCVFVNLSLFSRMNSGD